MRYVTCLILALTITGCAGRTLHKGPVNVNAEPTSAASPSESLETFMTKVRKLSEAARPEKAPIKTLEGNDDRLGMALATALVSPSPGTYRAVADAYRHAGVFDKAHEYLNKARLLDDRDPATYDALARLWRDSGFPHLGLTDAHRAVYFAPGSPIARNTLGTVLQALGHRGLARTEYERALRLDPKAAYALNNLCYGWVLDANAEKAATACERALDIEPTSSAARNNLALAYAMAGDTARARETLSNSGDRAQTLYNAGIIDLAQRRYTSAVEAFSAAHAVKPNRLTLARVNQAQAAARAAAEE